MKLPPWILAVLGCTTLTTHLHGVEVVEHEGACYHLFRVDPADWPKLQLAWLGAKCNLANSAAGNLYDVSKGRETVFDREISQLLGAGYTRSGDYLLPPG